MGMDFTENTDDTYLFALNKLTNLENQEGNHDLKNEDKNGDISYQ